LLPERASFKTRIAKWKTTLYPTYRTSDERVGKNPGSSHAGFLKGEFEIHKPFVIPGTITKVNFPEHIANLQKSVMEKRVCKHDAYIVIVWLIVAAEGAIGSSVH
jgi:hypothetical protein